MIDLIYPVLYATQCGIFINQGKSRFIKIEVSLYEIQELMEIVSVSKVYFLVFSMKFYIVL